MMSEDKDKIKKLYDTFVSEGYDMESEDDFRKNISDEKKRKAAYDSLVKDGYDMEPFDQFEKNIGYGKTTEHAQAVATSNGKTGVEKNGKDEVIANKQNGTDVANVQTNGQATNVQVPNGQATSGQVPDGQTNGQAEIPVQANGTDAADVQQGVNGQAPIGQSNGVADGQVADGEAANGEDGQSGEQLTEAEKAEMIAGTNRLLRNADWTMEDFNRQVDNIQEYGLNPALQTKEGKMRVNPESGKLEKTYITPLGNRTASKALADMESFQYRQAADMSVNGQLRNAYLRLQELKEKEKNRALAVDEEWKKETEKNKAPLAAIFAADNYAAKQQSDKQKGAFRVAIRQTEELIKDLEDQRDREKGIDVGYWRGVGRVMGDSHTWDFGIQDLSDSMTMLNAHYLNDENATEEEKAAYNDMMSAIANKQEADQKYGGNKSFLYRAGVVTGYMPAYMLDFYFTGGGGEGMTIASKGAAKLATKVVGKEAIEAMAKQGFKSYIKNNGIKGLGEFASNWTIKAVGTAANDLLVRAPMITNTIQAAKTASDAIGRKLGGVVVDEHGNYNFENDKRWSSAIWQAEANQVCEDASELAGTHIEPFFSLGNVGKLAKVLGAKRIGNVLAKADAGALKGITAQTHKLFNKLGVADLGGEIAEEYIGQAYKTILDLDDAYQQNADGTRTNLFATKQFHIDTVGGIGLSMGLIVAAKHSYSAAGYATMKHGVNKADVRAGELLGKDIWEPLRATIDMTTNDNFGDVAELLITDKEFTKEQKTAVLDYMGRSLGLRGYNLASMAQSRGGAKSEREQQADESYIDGYSVRSPQEMNDAKNMYEYQLERAKSELGVNDEALEGDAIDWLNEAKNARDAGTEQGRKRADVIMDYVNAKQVRDGMMQRVRDDIDERIEQSNAMIDSRAHQEDGLIHPATMKLDDRKVYVIGGNVVMNEDGTGIDPEKSDKSVILRDAATGNVEYSYPEAILNVGQAQDAEEEKARTSEQLRQELAQEAANKVDGVLPFNDGDEYTIGDGEKVKVYTTYIDSKGEVLPMPEGTINVSTDGGKTFTAMTKPALQKEVDNYNRKRVELFEQGRKPAEEQEQSGQQGQGKLQEKGQGQGQQSDVGRPEYAINDEITLRDDEGNLTGASINATENEDGQIEVASEKPIRGRRVNLFTRDELDAMNADLNTPTEEQDNAATRQDGQDHAGTNEGNIGTNEENATANEDAVRESIPTERVVEPMPMIGKGDDVEPDYLSVSPQRSHAYIYGESGLPKEVADDLVKNNREAIRKEKEKLKKAEPKIGTSIANYRKALAEWQRKADDVRRRADYWDAVKAEQDKVASSERAEREASRAAERDKAIVEEQKRQAEVLRKKAEQERLGTNRVSPAIREKWEASPKIEGEKNELVLANGEKVAGRYVLTESGAATPSHDANAEFAKKEGFPVDEHGKSVNDRDYERDKDAQQVTREIAGNYDSRAMQTPVVVSKEGVVLSGNGRTMAGELAARQGTDGAYTAYLKKYGSQYGFTEEQVAGMQHPRVLFVPDEDMPYTADTFAKFNLQEMKGQNKTEHAVKMGKIVDDATFNRIVRTMNRYDRLSDFYADDDASTGAIKELASAGAISNAQMSEMFDGENVSLRGRELLENVLIGKAFESNPDAVRMITEYPAMRQAVIAALSEIVNNKSLGEDYHLEDELAKAIELVYHARKGGVKNGESVSSFARQGNLFEFDDGATVADYTNAAMMMLADTLNDSRTTRLKKILSIYYREAANNAMGQVDMFSGIQDKKDILKGILKLINYGTEEEQQAAINKSVEQRKESGIQQDGVASQGNDDGRRGRTGEETGERTGRAGSTGGIVDAEGKEIESVGIGPFGHIYTQFKGKAKEAVAFLLKKRSGEAVGALYHPEIGDINLVWGKAGTGKSNGFGLSKLAKYHPEVLDNLQDLLTGMKIVKRSENRINLESDTHKASVRLEWDGNRKNWLLTAFEKEAPTPIDKTTDTGDNQHDLQSDTALLQGAGASYGSKGIEVGAEKQRFGSENADKTEEKGGLQPSGKKLMQNSMENRSLDEEEDVFGDTVAQLSGIEYAMLKNQAEKDARKFESKLKQWESDQTYIHHQKPKLNGLIKASEQIIAKNEANLKTVEAIKGKASIQVGKTVYDDMEAMSDFIKGFNKKLKETEDRLRESPINEEQERKLSLTIGGIDFEVKTRMSKTAERKGGALTRVIKRQMSYSCRELDLKDVPVKQMLLRNALDDILTNVITGNDFRERIESGKESIERVKKDLEQLSKREGKPFEFAKELETAHQRVDEYTALMKKEMQEKEAKYAEMDDDVPEAKFVSSAKEDEEEADDLYREGREYELSEDEADAEAFESREDKASEAFAKRERVRMARKAATLGKQLGVEIEVLRSGDLPAGKKRESKGFYNKNTGKISLVLDNHSSVEDVEKTVLHEAVAHYGLRQLFGEHFDRFLDNVFAHAERGIREEITALAAKNGWDFRTATEEYLAGLAENTNFERAFHSAWFGKIKKLFLTMLHTIGFTLKGVTLSDNELRYVLWRSYENLAEPGRYRSILGKASDVSMQHALKVGDYETPAVGHGKVADSSGDELLFRKDSAGSDDQIADEPNLIARRIYDDAVADTGDKCLLSALASMLSGSKEARKRFRHKFAESFFDYSRSIRELQDAIAKSSGKKILSYENVWQSLNAKSSVDAIEIQKAKALYIDPLNEYIGQLIKGKRLYGEKMTLDDVEAYLNALHGEEERNPDMAERAAEAEAIDKNGGFRKEPLESDPDYDAKYDEWNEWRKDVDADKAELLANRKDYSGLTALFGDQVDDPTDVESLEKAAKEYCNDFEQAVGGAAATGKLNDLVRELNRFTLRKAYLSGLIGKQQYDTILNMYKYYVPLRGWHDDYAGDVYDYISNGSHAETVQGVVKKAYGRTSRAGHIIGTMEAMANMAIVQGNKNLVAQKFMNLALNHADSGLLMVSKQWYERLADGTLLPAEGPRLTEHMSTEEMQHAIEEYDAKMEALSQTHTNLVSHSFSKNFPYKLAPWQERAHSVRVMRNGSTYQVYVLGNPKAAQAFNGLLNPDSKVGAVGNFLKKWMRFSGMMQTSLNVEFWPGNFQRDDLTVFTGMYVKFGMKTAGRFQKNLFLVSPLGILGKKGDKLKGGGIFSLFKRYDKGTLDMNDEMQKYFKEFCDHGGMTGISSIHSHEDFDRELQKSIDRIRHNRLDMPRKATEAFFSAVEFINKGIENGTRFAVYMTMRQSGMSVGEAVFEAKESSVNFNMKGSGAWGNLWMRRNILYSNVALQALRMLDSWHDSNKGRFYTVMLSPLIVGFTNAMMMSLMGGGDDDDDNDWYALSEWNRYNYINVKNPFGNGYFHWSIPQELRPAYAMGQIAYDLLAGRITKEHALNATLAQVNNLSPVAFVAGGTDSSDDYLDGFVKSWTPTIASQFADAYHWNQNFLGSPITNQKEWNRYEPEWQRAGKDTPEWAVNLSRRWSEATGGSDHRRSDLDSKYLNPSAVYYLLEQQGGGVGDLVTKISKMCEQLSDPDEEVEPRTIPFVSKFYVGTDDEYSKNRGVNNKFWLYWNEYRTIDHEISGIMSDARNGKLSKEAYESELGRVKSSGDYDRWLELKPYAKPYNQLLKLSRDGNEDARRKLQELKRSIVKTVESAKTDRQ